MSTTSIVYNGYTAKQLGEYAYEANLRQNFLGNRNVRRGEPSCLEQAERDFRYVLGMAQGHAFALQGLARIATARGEGAVARELLAQARQAVTQNPKAWSSLVTALNLNLEYLT